MKRLLLVYVACSAPLAAQSVRGRLEGRVPPASIPVLDSLVQVAAHEHLPTEPLLQKAIEGGAKQVSGERIVKAVVRRELPNVPPPPPPARATVLRARRPGGGAPQVPER